MTSQPPRSTLSSSSAASDVYKRQPPSPHCSHAFRRVHADELPASNVFGSLREPTVVVGAAERVVLDNRRWSRSRILEAVGSVKVEPRLAAAVASGGPGLTAGEAPTPIDLSEYLQHVRRDPDTSGEMFVSAEQNPELFRSLGSMLRPDGPVQWLFGDSVKDDEHSLLLSLSGAGRGLPLHVHGAAWLLQLRGFKHWSVYPSTSNVSTLPDEHKWHLMGTLPSKWPGATQEWAASEAESAPQHCVLGPGELMLLPPGWFHATQNVGESIAIGGQVFWRETTLQQVQAFTDESSSTSAHTLKSEANFLSSALNSPVLSPKEQNGMAAAAIQRLKLSIATYPMQEDAVELLLFLLPLVGRVSEALRLFTGSIEQSSMLLKRGVYSTAEHASINARVARALHNSLAPEDMLVEFEGKVVAESVLAIYHRVLDLQLLTAMPMVEEALREFNQVFQVEQGHVRKSIGVEVSSEADPNHSNEL
eukprot:TRINITY_DN4900_c0_g1_i1.p1 TRINITY_DN4900_c0_g1~~TRINITY_DN4900_c0_g1_i1.p1  ORF type:complete len:477 (+),score=105.75 TRINITY_DN4900_c0_g1_i1:59-1489(+)